MNIQSKFLLLSICILLVLPSILLADCDMMALISINPKGIAACDPGAGDYDSPHDYFDFLRSRSGSQDLDIPLNCDGYGVIYYRLGESTLSKEQTFYKTGFHTWYEAIHGEPMNLAEDAIMTPMNRASIVLGHDRLGTGGFGSHPFTFIWNNKTYSFIHNGAISSSAKTAFMNYLGEEWFVEHPSNWHGVYGDIRSFIDSELLFHFIMSMIMESNGNIVLGIQKALNNHDLEGFDFRSEVFHGMNTVNFVLTDGTSLYVFRNSRMDPTLHNLSYNVINNRFIGIKTQEQTGIEIHQNEMIVFDQSGTITSIPMVSTLPVELSSFTGSVFNGIVTMRWHTASETGLSGFNIYRGDSNLFSQSIRLNTSLINPTNNPNGYTYEYSDHETSPGATYYYWLECIDTSGTSTDMASTTVTVPNIGNNDIPDYAASVMLPNFPNPFSRGDITTIPLQLRAEDSGILVIYNVKGQKVNSFAIAPNTPSLVWNGCDSKGQICAPGIYFAQLKTKDISVTHKLLMIR